MLSDFGVNDAARLRVKTRWRIEWRWRDAVSFLWFHVMIDSVGKPCKSRQCGIGYQLAGEDERGGEGETNGLVIDILGVRDVADSRGPLCH